MEDELAVAPPTSTAKKQAATTQKMRADTRQAIQNTPPRISAAQSSLRLPIVSARYPHGCHEKLHNGYNKLGGVGGADAFSP